MTEKILTVIVPMYNATAYIERCLRSMLVRPDLRQYLEVLVINDGSTDGCEKKAQKVAQEYPDLFCVIHKKNGGHGSAINEGVARGSGKYIKIVDADDLLELKELEKFILQLRKLKDPDVILCAYQVFDMKIGRTERICSGAGTEKYLDMEGLIARWGQYRPVCTFHGMVYRTEFYKKNSGRLPERVFYDDGYYTIVPASHAQTIYLSSRSLYVYCIGMEAQSVSAENRIRHLKDAYRVINAICNTRKDCRSAKGQQFWEYRTVSFISDYLVTCFLRFPDKKTGRSKAKRFMNKLWKKYPQVAGAVQKKYYLLKWMGYLHVSEQQFQKMLWNRKKYKR
ncbi:MAG: glycosyltransferase family 2 protein [Eubacterium sp.]|nr:glycosyltransferase family 2 protein [Eubacterium sp.]